MKYRLNTSARDIWVVADTHVNEGDDSEKRFLELLESISDSSDDVVFLGDIMDLWIGISRYETKVQTSFIDWCLREKERRRVYFLEGNHEYYVVRNHRNIFFEASEDYLVIDGVYFAHGHTIQGKWYSFNRMFCLFAKSLLARCIMALLPFGGRFAAWLKRKLSGRGKGVYVPKNEIVKWLSEHKFSEIVLGHFHKSEEIISGDKKATVIQKTF